MTKEQTVSDEEQALMAIKLADNVRELVRKEIKAALEDYEFMLTTQSYPLASAVFRSASGTSEFRNAVLGVVTHQMQKP